MCVEMFIGLVSEPSLLPRPIKGPDMVIVHVPIFGKQYF